MKAPLLVAITAHPLAASAGVLLALAADAIVRWLA